MKLYWPMFLLPSVCTWICQLAKTLHALTEKNANFKWTEECDKAFQTLKDHLTKVPVLAYPDFDKPFILDTAASDVAIGATLSQMVDEEHPIGYFSRTLTGPEKQYCVTWRELLAVVHAASHFHPYLYGNQFALTGLNSKQHFYFKQYINFNFVN